MAGWEGHLHLLPALSLGQQPWGHVSNGARAQGGGFPASGCKEAFRKAGMQSRGAAMKPKTASPGPWVSTSGPVLAAAGGPRDGPISAAAAPLLLLCPTSPGCILSPWVLGVRCASWLATSQCNVHVGECNPWCSMHLSLQGRGCCAPWRVQVPGAARCYFFTSMHFGACNSLCNVHLSACNPCCSAHLAARNSLHGAYLRVCKALGSVHVGVQRPVQMHLDT